MIQGTPKIVDGIADYAGDFGRDGTQAFDFVDAISSLRILLGVDFAWVTVGKDANPAIEVADVVLGPFDFDPGAI
jgi:hypothetical protein